MKAKVSWRLAASKLCYLRRSAQNRWDVERVDGRAVRVLNLKVNVCAQCGGITPKWWTSFDEIDRMLSARFEREPFEAVTWEDLISDYASPFMLPS